MNMFKITDSGVESSTAFATDETRAPTATGVTTDEDPEGSPTLEVAMQRLADTIKEFDSHSRMDSEELEEEEETEKDKPDTETEVKKEKPEEDKGKGKFVARYNSHYFFSFSVQYLFVHRQF